MKVNGELFLPIHNKTNFLVSDIFLMAVIIFLISIWMKFIIVDGNAFDIHKTFIENFVWWNAEKITECCCQWHLKPLKHLKEKIVILCFYLNNLEAERELNVAMYGFRLKHKCCPKYITFTFNWSSHLISVWQDG